MIGLNTLLDLIEKEKQAALLRWSGITSVVERQLMDAAIQWIQDNLQIEKGTVVVDKELPKLLTDLQNTVVDVAVKSKEYQEGIFSFIQSIKEIQDNITKLHAEVNNINIRDVVGPVQNIVVEELVDRLSENGLNTHFAAPLRELVYNKFMAGQNMKQMRVSLEEYIMSGKDKSGKLGSYITQTVQQGADSFTAATNLAIQEHFKSTGMIISGSLIETSSRQCIMAVEESLVTGGYLSNAQWEVILTVARSNPKATLIPGTTLKNLDWNKLHWGCRHNFTPVLDPKNIKEKEKDKAARLKTVEDLAAKAKAAAPAMEKITQEIAANHGAAITPINLKSQARIEEKAVNEYNGDVSKVKDAVRTTIISPKGNIEAIIADIKKQFPVEKIKIQDAATDPLGYSGNLINIKAGSGIFAEIQVNTPEMIYAKEPLAEMLIGKAEFERIKKATGLEHGLGHKLYEEYRILKPTDAAKRLELEEKSKEYYKHFL